MNANAFIKVDKATFYRFVEHNPDGRYEYVRGRIMQQMTGGTKRHMVIAGRITDICKARMDRSVWLVLEGRGIETTITTRHGDVVVEKQSDAAEDSLWTNRPYLVVEVLSRWSEDRDMFVKPSEYLTLETLQAYIIADQNEPACLVYLRNGDGSFPEEPVTVMGLDKVIDIPTLSLSISLAEVYGGLPPAPPVKQS
jgi:Uma2 family endonuclease